MREIKLDSKPEGVSLNSRVIHLLKTHDLRLQLFWQPASNLTTLKTSKLTALITTPLWDFSVRFACSKEITVNFLVFFLVVFLWSRAGCWWVRSLLQIVVQLFWTSSWLALAKVSFSSPSYPGAYRHFLFSLHSSAHSLSTGLLDKPMSLL